MNSRGSPAFRHPCWQPPARPPDLRWRNGPPSGRGAILSKARGPARSGSAWTRWRARRPAGSALREPAWRWCPGRSPARRSSISAPARIRRASGGRGALNTLAPGRFPARCVPILAANDPAWGPLLIFDHRFIIKTERPSQATDPLGSAKSERRDFLAFVYRIRTLRHSRPKFRWRRRLRCDVASVAAVGARVNTRI